VGCPLRRHLDCNIGTGTRHKAQVLENEDDDDDNDVCSSIDFASSS
jgi:hypothetical protein